jgi:hypothetical protein
MQMYQPAVYLHRACVGSVVAFLLIFMYYTRGFADVSIAGFARHPPACDLLRVRLPFSGNARAPSLAAYTSFRLI